MSSPALSRSMIHGTREAAAAQRASLLVGLLGNSLNQCVGNIVVSQCIGDCDIGIDGVSGKVPHLSEALDGLHLVVG